MFVTESKVLQSSFLGLHTQQIMEVFKPSLDLPLVLPQVGVTLQQGARSREGKMGVATMLLLGRIYLQQCYIICWVEH